MVVKFAQPNVRGTLVGVLLLGELVSGTALLGWPDWQRQVIKGCLLLGAASSCAGGRRRRAREGRSRHDGAGRVGG